MSVDEKGYELAQHFLEGQRAAMQAVGIDFEEQVQELAEKIQYTVELFTDYLDRRIEGQEK